MFRIRVPGSYVQYLKVDENDQNRSGRVKKYLKIYRNVRNKNVRDKTTGMFEIRVLGSICTVFQSGQN